jgi:curli biogenesis system outer membrane secretion channel CsgG
MKRIGRRGFCGCALGAAFAASAQPVQIQPPDGPGQPANPTVSGLPPGTGNPAVLQAGAGRLPNDSNLPNAPGSPAAKRNTDRPTVTIREFRSSVGEITPRGATDMFISALVKTRKFRVVERARLAEGAAAEKALNQQGMTTGAAGQSQYVAAMYMFEATISEASANDRKTTFMLGMAGANAAHGSVSDSIVIDVRVTDVESGVVVDAVDVRKELKTVETKVSGVTSALANLLTRGRASQAVDMLSPTDETTSARKDSLDRALREAIEEAVGVIAKRFAAD